MSYENPVSAWLRREADARPDHADVLRELASDFEIRHAPRAGREGFDYVPDLTRWEERLAYRAMEACRPALKRAFRGETVTPNVTLLVSAPPDGYVAIASSEPTPADVEHAVTVALGSVRRAMRLGPFDGKRRPQRPTA